MSDQLMDLVVVGAGWHGLAAAKTYFEVRPQANILIVDTAKSIGGVWAKERLYPGLKTNNLVGSYEFGDFPMSLDRYGLHVGQHIPGAVVHEYLSDFATRFGLTSKLRFQTKVEAAELQDDGDWILTLSSTTGSDVSVPSSIRTKKLVVATGLTSEPSMPQFPGRERFKGNLLHSINLKDRAKDIETAREVVVLGANKSAWDTCFSAATSGAHVNMVIRPSGGGPSWVWPVTFTPFQLSIQRLATTRFCSLFEPCLWASGSGYAWARRLLHRTWLGRKLVASFWSILSSIILNANGYDSHPELRKLKPWSSTFWMGNSLGVHNYDENWFDLVRKGRITIHIADVMSLSESGVHLSNGNVINADTFVCCTGWKTVPPIKFLPESIIGDLGIGSGIPSSQIEADAQNAAAQVLREAPILQDGPVRTLPPSSAAPVQSAENTDKTHSAFRLYRFLVPASQKFLHHRNIAFIGAHLAINAVTVAQAQALWITAYFQNEIGNLAPATVDYAHVRYQTVLHTEYCRLRHPHEGGGAGNKCPDLCFDGLLYTDLLMRDLGLSPFRKGSKWAELFARYQPADYAGVTTEWLEKKRIALT